MSEELEKSEKPARVEDEQKLDYRHVQKMINEALAADRKRVLSGVQLKELRMARKAGDLSREQYQRILGVFEQRILIEAPKADNLPTQAEMDFASDAIAKFKRERGITA